MKENQYECVVCRKAKNCTVLVGPIYVKPDPKLAIDSPSPRRKKDMFVYSENHRGWICLKCLKAGEKTVRLPLFELDRGN